MTKLQKLKKQLTFVQAIGNVIRLACTCVYDCERCPYRTLCEDVTNVKIDLSTRIDLIESGGDCVYDDNID